MRVAVRSADHHGVCGAISRYNNETTAVQGPETFPDTLTKLFTGANFGRLVLQVVAK